jgi:mannose-1-phosphate guanylyltransferase
MMDKRSTGNTMVKNADVRSSRTCIDTGHLWSIILAGGNGDRISDLTCEWLGRKIPKQYCSFVGRQSMLQHTIMRAEMIGKREHLRTLIARAHQREALPQLADRWGKGVIVQPSNCDTLPGIFLPLTHVYARDSKATVAIYPSDHFIYPQEKFVHVIQRAVQAVEEMPHMMLLVGAPAHSLELDYGWICPGEDVWKSGEYAVRKVRQFMEKPHYTHAATAKAAGGLWNTLIIVAKAQTLWQLGCIYAPEVLRYFERLYDVIGTSHEEAVLESIYEIMPKRNFSKDLLTPAAKQIGVIPMNDVLWSDWGRKERIVETLSLIGKQPNFPVMLTALEKPEVHDFGSLSIAS